MSSDLTRGGIRKYVNWGYVLTHNHPTLPLKIYNYSKLAQFEEYWNPITTRCRGLVLDKKNRIIVNPPPKFFNEGEDFAPKLNPNKCVITEKLDGYLVSITKDHQYGLIVASRGSFDNQYTEAAKKFITPNIQDNLLTDVSYFCELCQNFKGDEQAIVTKHYEPALICWAIRTQDGEELNPQQISPFPFAEQITDIKSYLDGEVEGVVLFNPKTGERVKIKTDWWLEQHKLRANFTKLMIYRECFVNKRHVYDLGLPDELLGQAYTWYLELGKDYASIYRKAQGLHKQTSDYHPKDIPQVCKDYASLVFCLRKKDRKSLDNLILKRIKPKLSKTQDA